MLLSSKLAAFETKVTQQAHVASRLAGQSPAQYGKPMQTSPSPIPGMQQTLDEQNRLQTAQNLYSFARSSRQNNNTTAPVVVGRTSSNSSMSIDSGARGAGVQQMVIPHAAVAGRREKKNKKSKKKKEEKKKKKSKKTQTMDTRLGGGGDQKSTPPATSPSSSSSSESDTDDEEEEEDDNKPKPRDDRFLDEITQDQIRNNWLVKTLWEFIEMLAESDRTRLSKTHTVATVPVRELWNMDRTSERYISSGRGEEKDWKLNKDKNTKYKYYLPPDLQLSEDNFNARYKYYVTPKAEAAIEQAYSYVKSSGNISVSGLKLNELLADPDLRRHFLGLTQIQLQRSLDPTAYRSASNEAIRTLNAIELMHFSFFQTAVPVQNGADKFEFRAGV